MVDTWKPERMSGSFEVSDRTVKLGKFFRRDTGTVIRNRNTDGAISDRNV